MGLDDSMTRRVPRPRRNRRPRARGARARRVARRRARVDDGRRSVTRASALTRERATRERATVTGRGMEAPAARGAGGADASASASDGSVDACARATALAVDMAKVARAVGAATKGLAREGADAYEFAEEDSARGRAREIARAERKEGADGGAMSGASETERGVGAVAREEVSEGAATTSREVVGGGDRAAGGGGRRGEAGGMDEPYARFEDLFGASALFARSGSRARSSQVDMYLQDYMDRRVYGYAHVSVRRKLPGGRPRARREVEMERRTVGVGRPEDALEFGLGEDPKCAVRHPPLQALPTCISMHRGEKGKDIASLPPTHASRREGAPKAPVRAVAAPTPKVPVQKQKRKIDRVEKIDKIEPISKNCSAADLTLVPAHNKPLTVADVAKQAATPVRPKTALAAMPSPNRGRGASGASPMICVDIPGTIFDGDFIHDDDADMVFWDALNNGLDQPTPKRIRTIANEGAQSPSYASDKTGSPKAAAQLSAVERRLRALEAKLSSGELHAELAKAPQPVAQPPYSDGNGSADRASPRDENVAAALHKSTAKTSSPTFDDTARAGSEEYKKRTLSSGGDERAQATSAPSQATAEEIHALKETILALQQRQDTYEIERRRHQDQMQELVNMHKERTSALESMIEAYEARFRATIGMSPRTPLERSGAHERAWSYEPSRFTAGREYPSTAPRPEAPGSSRRPHTADRFDPFRRAPSTDPRDRASDVETLMDREMRYLERTLIRKNDVIASLAGELGQSKYDRWDI